MSIRPTYIHDGEVVTEPPVARPEAEVATEFAALLLAVHNAAYDCVGWTGEDESYTAVFTRSPQADAALTEYVASLTESLRCAEEDRALLAALVREAWAHRPDDHHSWAPLEAELDLMGLRAHTHPREA